MVGVAAPRWQAPLAEPVQAVPAAYPLQDEPPLQLPDALQVAPDWTAYVPLLWHRYCAEPVLVPVEFTVMLFAEVPAELVPVQILESTTHSKLWPAVHELTVLQLPPEDTTPLLHEDVAVPTAGAVESVTLCEVLSFPPV
jgi:hypothetical protein